MNFPLKWYAATETYNTYEHHVQAPYIRRTFTLTAVRSAEILVSGLGFYDLYLNGQRITKGLLAPYISNPDDLVYFDRYDVTELLNAGKNAVGLILGNGMQNAHGGRVWDFDIAKFRGVPRFTLRFSCTLENGETFSFEADEAFRTAPSPILFDDLRSGTFYDARLAIADWCAPDFDDSDWTPVHAVESPRGECRVCQADPIVISSALKPVAVTEATLCETFNNRKNMQLDTQFKFNARGTVGTLFDFGVNTAGILRLKIKGIPDQKIFIQCCEFVTSKGEPSYQNIDFYPDGYAQTELYICKGEGEEIFEAPFTYHGFRYAWVSGLLSEQAVPETLTLLVAHSDLQERGNFNCSDDVMVKLGVMARRSDLANFFYFPTDCPHREKNGWTGDAATSAEHMLLTLTPERSYKEWLRSICKAQDDAGQLPGIVPTGGWGMEWGNGPAWDNVLTELCWQIYRLQGDLTPAEECAENMLRYLSYIDARRRADGLVEVGLGDWLQPLHGAGEPTAPLFLTDSVITMYIARKSADLFKAMGKPMQATFAETLYSSMRDAIRTHCIDFATMTAVSRCQTAQAICLYYGVFDDSEKAEASRVLVELVHENGDSFDCGMIGMRVLFHVLSDCGEGDLAYRMITKKTFPSYGYFLKQGLTAMPEDFRPDLPLDNPASLNHHFFGDIVSWFIQRVVGIRPNPKGLGVDTFEITPDFIDTLDEVSAHYDSPVGTVIVSWKKEGDSVLLRMNCPAEAKGIVRFPKGYVCPENSRHILNATVLPLESATYRLKKIAKFTK